MADYRAPVKDMGFVINELAGLADIAALPGYEEATPDLVEAVMEEAALLATQVIAPTNLVGDAKGSRVENGQVIVPPEFHSAYQQYVEGGWPSIVNDPEYGGQGMPLVLGAAINEMVCSSNMAFGM